jgi:hypothetical protein
VKKHGNDNIKKKVWNKRETYWSKKETEKIKKNVSRKKGKPWKLESIKGKDMNYV